ncbi:MAG: type II secretion system F family protein, partial [Chloroflexi bacterium]|nr:type II secretion system F family protein [Chloroflexota bacterium]
LETGTIMQELLLILAGLSVFLMFAALGMPSGARRKTSLAEAVTPQMRARGSAHMLRGVARQGVRRALRSDGTNAKYLRLLKQANWYWAPGEPSMPNPKAPFWNLETMWAKKMSDGLTFGGITAALVLIVGVVLALTGQGSLLVFVAVAVLLGGMVGWFAYASPDSGVAAVAATRQRELTLEMGFRIPELRADVLAGNTIQRAIRNMSRRPGGPFVEELRHAVTVLDVTKDDTLAMDQLIERNGDNELLIEFANSLKLVSRQGGQIAPVLNVLADLAQQRLRLTIQGQARKNLQEMTRPIGLSNMMVTTLLIIAPALIGVMGSLAK